MKKGVLFVVLMFFAIAAYSQFDKLEIGGEKADSVEINILKTWKIDERYGRADTVMPDTSMISYPDDNPINRYSIVNAWNGNLGSPVESKLYFDRTMKTLTMFSSAFDPYTIKPADLTFFNTKKAFSNLTYRSTFVSYREEDYLKALLTMNANKHLNFGGLCNYIYARGQYANQSNQMLSGGLWSSYSGKRYEFNAAVLFNNFKLKENGGLSDMTYILDPQSIVGNSNLIANNIPVNLNNVQTRYRNYNYYYNHKYSLGIERERILPNDSIVYDFVPVTSFIHSILFEDVRRVYTEKDSITNNFYENTYYSGKYTKDSLSFWSLKNTFSVTLEEKYNTLLKFGLAAFVEYDIRHYGVGFDTILSENSYSHNLRVGGVMSKKEGKYVKYQFDGSVYVVGPQIGEFDINGRILGDFKIARESFEVLGFGSFMHTSPYHLMYNYHSNHYMWEQRLKNSFVTQFGGRISMPKRDMSLGFKMENNSCFTYLDKKGIPVQYAANLQVIAVDAILNLDLWKFHWDNKLVYQYTSNREVLALPDFSVYTNLYFLDKVFKVLTMQLGVSMRYHTAYYSNVYVPALGQFIRQDEMKVGNYPEMNVYANFHLKGVRFYVQYAHWNQGLFGGNNYFSMPYYPLNPATFQFGLSWNFWQ